MGVAFALTSWLAFVLIGTGRSFLALLVLLALLAIIVTASVALGTIIRKLPWSRAGAVNLLAVAPASVPRFLVVAHRDSKSQPVPLVLRIGAAVAVLIAWLLLASAAAGLWFEATPVLARAAMGLGIAGGLLLAVCGVGNASQGALDNASGVTALLDLAARERDAADVAFLVTDAEEFGLAGARAAAAVRAAPRTEDMGDVVVATSLRSVEAVINLDGLDDRGVFILLEGRLPAFHATSPLQAALLAAFRATGATARRRPIPPGLLIDHLPFRSAGIPAVTIMRGGLRSLARVHRPGDRADRLTGEGAARTAVVVAGALDRLRTGRNAQRGAARVARTATTA
jgi:hypothetical protein